jgi:hypothetical protein
VPEEGIPERLGPYRLRERLGEGGMGVVYLATDPALRLVAVKALRHGVAGGDTSRRRLTREFETMRRVHSPFVAEVIDANVQHDPPYIVTRYVPGRTVEDLVADEGPLTGRSLHRLARGLACALTAVHGAGIVHRDLKPGNVMLVSGEPVVIDFGIAQALDSSRLTSTGMLMGTPGYLAPEVIEGSPSGPAADVHSWAATLAYAATGRPPFGSGSYEAIFYRIVNGQPDLATMPAPLLPLVLSALARDPARRPAAAELAERVAMLDPAALVPDLAATVPPGVIPPAGPGTGANTSASTLAAPAAIRGAVPPAGSRRPDNYADLLPPVRYGPPPVAPVTAPGPPAAPWVGQAGRPPGQFGPGQFGPGQFGPGQFGPGQFGPGQLGPGQAHPGQPGYSGVPYPATADRSRSGRPALVLAAMASLVAVSVLLPVAGTAVALAVLVALRSADLTSSRLLLRRTRKPGPGAAAAIAYAPVAVLRSVLNMALRLPLALLFAAVAAAVALLTVPGNPTRAAGYAAGALITCYAVGPGSARSRRPLSRFFGAVTGSAPSAAVVFIGMAALALGMVAAAISLPPFIWPAVHYSPHFAQLSWIRELKSLPGQFTKWRNSLNSVSNFLG